MISILELIARRRLSVRTRVLVSATKAKAADSQPDPDFFWYGWADVVPEGILIFRPTPCMPGGPISSREVQKQVRQLGKGQTPKN
jgi:hypothetical protein